MSLLPKAKRDIIMAHLSDPRAVTQAEAMKRLKLNRNYNQFYSMVYQTVCLKK